jgi:hypothetical protein
MSQAAIPLTPSVCAQERFSIVQFLGTNASLSTQREVVPVVGLEPTQR